MARSMLPSVHSLVTTFLVLSSTTTALQVSPNSPCAASCLDSADLDRSDPSSSNTKNSDISCEDVDYTGEERGKKFKECMTCLQDSTFSRGTESDLGWFLYNLRYAFGVCIFGYPNATGIGSNPCMTSEACGPLESAFTQGIKNPGSDTDEFAYCKSNDQSTFEHTYPSCLACISADDKRRYLANFLIALEAGCEQLPSQNNTIALNDTIFASITPSIVNTTTALEDSHHNSGLKLPIAAIIVIAIGGLILAALAIGCTYIQLRKRRNRREREERAQHFRSSSLEFRCATHVNPFSPGFRNSNDGWHESAMQEQYQQPQPYQEGATDKETAVVDEKEYAEAGDALHSHPPAGPVRNFSRKDKRPGSITTTMNLAEPDAALMVSPRRESPSDYGSPASATSQRSNVPFLASFNSRAAAVSPSLPGMTYSPAPKMSSPLVKQASWEDVRGNSGAGLGLSKPKGRNDTGAPVAARQIQTSFPPPPKQ